MKTKDVKVGMKFEDMDGCQFEVVSFVDRVIRVYWFGHSKDELDPDQHNQVFPASAPDSEFTLWTGSTTPCTLLNPEQFPETAVTQNKPQPAVRYKHTVEITTTRAADDLERSLAGDAYTAKVVKSEQLREPFPVGYKYRYTGDPVVYEVRHYDADCDAYFNRRVGKDSMPGWDWGDSVRNAEEVK